jgi:UDP-glucose:(heptosyl)LPS alpha-1,3-glucosyltransferase
MKIALIKRQCSLKIGGSERYCVMLARHLMRQGHAVTVIGEKMDADLLAEIPFIPVPISRWTSSTKNKSFAINAGIAAKKGGFDIVYGLGRAFGVDAVRVTERLQAHWINVYYEEGWSRWLQHQNPRHRTLINLEREIYQAESTRRIVTQSTLDRRLLQQYYQIDPAKIRTIPNGIDTNTFHRGVMSQREAVRHELNVPPEASLLIFASMDFEGKGLRTLIEGLTDTRLKSCYLLVLGTGPIAKFKQLATQLGVESRIIFAGRRSGIQNYYGAGDMFVLPTEYEPFPNVNLEAMACGLPVITTRTSGSIDFITAGETGFFLSHRKARDEFVLIVDQYLQENEVARRNMQERCLATAAQFTIERNVASTIQVFEEVISDRYRLRKVG